MKIFEGKLVAAISIVSVVVLTTGVIGWLFLGEARVAKETVGVKDAPMLNSGAPGMNGVASRKKAKDTIVNLLKTEADNQKCAFTTTIPNHYDGDALYTYTGNVYFSGDKVRIDHDSPMSGSGNIGSSSHLILDGAYQYLWTQSSHQIKVKFPSPITRKGNLEKMVDPIDVSRVYDFDCEPLDNTDVFMPPSDIDFFEIDKSHDTDTPSSVSELKTSERQSAPISKTSPTEYSDASYQDLSVTDSKQVVAGYLWHSYKGSPNFLSVSLPRLGIYVGKDDSKTKYTIDIWDGNQFTFYAEALPGEEVVFPQGGVYEFRVTGIDPEFKICPGDRGYIWGIKFVSSGRFEGARIPLGRKKDAGKVCVSNNIH